MSYARIIWNLMPKAHKQFLEESLPLLEYRQLGRMIKGRMNLPESFVARKAVYVHVPKTAGSSIAALLFPDEKDFGHMPYAWYERLEPKINSDYFTFSFVRNPWDRLVSAYHYIRSGGAPKRDKKLSLMFADFKNFDDFVDKWVNEDNINSHLHFIPQSRFLTNFNGVLDLDFVGRFEDLRDGLEIVLKNLDVSGVKVSSLKKINAVKRDGYKKYYSDNAINVVSELYKKDVELFGYSY
ncbi:sulfotransferase family 2 domain-containing protein [Porticoccus sp.]